MSFSTKLQKNQKFRQELFNTWSLLEVLDCSKFKIFDSATVMNSIFTFKKDNSCSTIVGYKPTDSSNSFLELIAQPMSNITKENLLSMNQNWGLAFRLSQDKLRLVQKLASQDKTLDCFFDCSQGYIPYRLSDLVKKYGKTEGTRIKKERLWHSEEKSEEFWIQELYGRDITKYSYCPTGNYVKYGKHVATYVDMKFFNLKRVVVREITNPGIVATIVDETFVNDPQLLPLIANENNPLMSYESLWALLNSRLATFFHFNHSPKATKGAFPKILIQDLNNFPVPNGSTDLWGLLNKKACTCLALGKNKADTSALEAEIDQLVYQLYGLTDDEISIIENSTK